MKFIKRPLGVFCFKNKPNYGDFSKIKVSQFGSIDKIFRLLNQKNEIK